MHFRAFSGVLWRPSSSVLKCFGRAPLSWCGERLESTLPAVHGNSSYVCNVATAAVQIGPADGGGRPTSDEARCTPLQCLSVLVGHARSRTSFGRGASVDGRTPGGRRLS